jgi:cysteine desulfurase
MSSPIFLDYAASTPTDPEVIDVMGGHLAMDGVFANPASRGHVYGWQAEEAVETARVEVANTLNADPREIIWTSGATESDNLAIKGLLERGKRLGRMHLITSTIEHKAILDTFAWMEKQGFTVSYLAPDSQGVVSEKAVADAIRPNTLVASIMQVNNELGSISDIGAIARVCRERGVLSHTDAAQSYGKLPIDVEALGVDLLSLSGHKIYGPKGVGALYVRRADGLSLEAQIHGGGHEMGMRSGTLPTHQIVGLSAAARLMHSHMAEETPRIQGLRHRFAGHLTQMPDVFVTSSAEVCIPQIVNVAFGGVDGETLLLALSELAISTGSACNSTSVEPSHVLRGIGLSTEMAQGSLRFSFGRYTTLTEIDQAARHLSQVLGRLRQ